MLRGREPDCFAEGQEKLIRSVLKDFPYVDSQLLHQMVRSLTDVKIVSNELTSSELIEGSNTAQRKQGIWQNSVPCRENGGNS